MGPNTLKNRRKAEKRAERERAWEASLQEAAKYDRTCGHCGGQGPHYIRANGLGVIGFWLCDAQMAPNDDRKLSDLETP